MWKSLQCKKPKKDNNGRKIPGKDNWMKDCILIVEPVSTGKNYMFDALKRGYQPVVIFPYMEENGTEYEAMREAARLILPEGVIEIQDQGEYEKVLEEVKKYPVRCVVVGSEVGAEMADRLAEDLGLSGNPSKSSELHRDKEKMQIRLEERGLAHIRGRFVHSVEEAEAFLDEEHLTEAVVKPKDGAGSVGVHLCHSREEILKNVEEGLSTSNFFGNVMDGILVQELLVGTEYIVDTISRDGIHYISDVWRYDKIPVGGGVEGNAYNYIRLVTRMNAEEYDMCKYALDVVDALDIKYGPTHGEYMLTSHGPVLIEVGARPMGTGFTAGYMDQILGHHITDISLDAYLEPERFEKKRNASYRPCMEAMIKLMLMKKETQYDNIPMISIIRNLDSVITSNMSAVIPLDLIPKTIDLETACGFIFMGHPDSRVLEHDYGVLHSIEMNMSEMLFSSTNQKEQDFHVDELKESLAGMHLEGDTLVFCKEKAGIENAVTMEDAFAVKDEFDNLVLWFDGLDCGVEEEIAACSHLIRRLKKQGKVIVAGNMDAFPYGEKGILMMLESNNVIIEIPKWGGNDYIIGLKRRLD